MKSEVSKLNVRLPVELREDASHVASRLGLSLNAFVVQAVNSYTTYMAQRLAKVQRTMPDQGSATAVVRQDVPAAVRDRPGVTGPGQVTAAQSRVAKVGANQPCPCGSGEKYKRCHGRP
jgi:preprotein translocase subunit SecA